MQDRVGGRLGLRTDFYEAAPPMGHRHIGPTDPARVRRALAATSPHLPRQARSRLLAEGGFGAAPLSLDRYPYIHGQALAPWLAKATLLEHVCGAREVSSLWERLAAYRDANAPGPWLPSHSQVIVAERPQQVRTEDVVAPGQSPGNRRLHADDGPAVLWRDGTAAYVVHGLRLPFDLMQHGWPVQRILNERNAEIRRIAVERLTWDRFVAEANLALVHGPVPDPGNPGNTLALYDLPPVYAIGTRLLPCTNARAT